MRIMDISTLLIFFIHQKCILRVVIKLTILTLNILHTTIYTVHTNNNHLMKMYQSQLQFVWYTNFTHKLTALREF